MLRRACSSSSEHMVASHSSSGTTRRRWDQPQWAVFGEMCHLQHGRVTSSPFGAQGRTAHSNCNTRDTPPAAQAQGDSVSALLLSRLLLSAAAA